MAIYNCEICGIEFKAHPSHKRRFCSRKCFHDWYIGNVAKGEQHQSWKGGLVKRTCEICGKEFGVPPSELKRGYKRGRYCSAACRSSAYNGGGNPKAKWAKILTPQKIDEIFEKWRVTGYSLDEMAIIESIPKSALAQTLRKHDDYEQVSEIHLNKGRLYRIGANFERRVRDYLRSKGYWVLRSPHSKSVVDLVAIKIGIILFIQCKVGVNKLNQRERDELVELAKSVQAKPIFAYRKSSKEQWEINLDELLDGGESLQYIA